MYKCSSIFFVVAFVLFYAHSASAALIIQRPVYVGLTQGLVGSWSFDGPDMAGVQAYDRSGSYATGTLTSGPVRTVGKIGQGLSFDGVDDYVDIGDKTIYKFPDNDFSIALWFKSDGRNLASKSSLVAKGGGQQVSAYVLQIGFPNSNSVGVNIGASGCVSWLLVNTEQFTWDVNQWTHVGVIKQGTNVRFYKNGALVNSATLSSSSICDNSQSLRIGGESDADGGAIFSGHLDDVRIYNRALSADEIKRLYKIGSTFKVNAPRYTDSLQRGLVGAWSFDGPDMSLTKAHDRSGNGNDGVLTNGPRTALGRIGQALEFDGVDDYVTTSDIAAMDDQTAFTVSQWVYLNSTADDQTFTGKNAGGVGLFTQTFSGNDVAFGFNASSFVYTNANVVSTGVWQHWVGVYDNALGTNKHKIYLNGVRQAVTNNTDPDSVTSTGANTAIFEIGRNNALGRYVAGTIDDVRIYNRALSAEEVKRLYNVGR